jgi:hypothetical protein
MPTPKRRDDAPEQLRFRSMLATIGSGLVDHRLLLQLVLVLVASVSFLTWGPDGVRDGLTSFTQWGPVREVSRATSAVWGVVLDGLRAVDRATVRAGVTPVADSSAALAKKPALALPGGAPAAGAASSPVTPMPQQPPRINDTLQAVRTTGSALDLGGTAAETPDPDPPDAILWTLEKDREIIRAEMHDRGKPGVDLQLFRNGQLWRSERWADRAASRNEAQTKRADFEKQGWTHRPA